MAKTTSDCSLKAAACHHEVDPVVFTYHAVLPALLISSEQSSVMLSPDSVIPLSEEKLIADTPPPKRIIV
jgi:hypothetical protein